MIALQKDFGCGWLKFSWLVSGRCVKQVAGDTEEYDSKSRTVTIVVSFSTESGLKKCAFAQP